MNPGDVKQKMMELWKNIFHDSDQYISLIFDNYFDTDYTFYKEVEGEIVAGLLGVPYSFGNVDNNLRALYLCGLATHPEHRSQGYMTELLEMANRKAASDGFAFTFLIPSDEGLRKYYHDRNYVNAFYRVVDNYTSLHDFDLEYQSILAEQKEKVADLKRRYYDNLSCDYISASKPATKAEIEALKALISGIENSQLDLQIIHSDRDIEILIPENAVSNGAIHFCLNNTGNITAAAFCSISDHSINIQKLYATDVASKFKVLGAVKKAWPELSIRHYIPSIEMDRNALWSRTYGSFMTDSPQVDTISVTERVYSLAAHAKVYGMARILNLPEILKFQAYNRNDLKYSILIKTNDPEVLEQIETKNGQVNIKHLPTDEVAPSKLAYLMTRRDIAEILFRRRDTDNLITEAFGIPSINGAICLMLD